MAEPVIAYPGAKWRFWKSIKPYIPKDIKDWREPFLGGASMSLSIADDPEFSKLERMVVGDLAPEIWAMWTGIRNNAPDVCDIVVKWFTEQNPHHSEFKSIPDISAEYLASHPEYMDIYNIGVEEGQKFWKWTQEVDCSTLSIPERAARTFLVNKISFSGMGDSGSLSKERYQAVNLESTDRIMMAQPLLQRMEIKNCSFEETMADVDPNGTFVFLDPPYYKQESSGLYGRGGDTHHGFPHDHFAEFTKNTNCKWFVTYDDSVKVRQMFKGNSVYSGKPCKVIPFTIEGGYVMAMRNSEDALAGEEVFIMNYDHQEEDAADLL